MKYHNKGQFYYIDDPELQNILYKLHSIKLALKSTQRKTIAVSLYNFHAATGENMLVVDSKPLRNLTRHLIKSAIRKILQQRGSDSIKNGVWQVTMVDT